MKANAESFKQEEADRKASVNAQNIFENFVKSMKDRKGQAPELFDKTAIGGNVWTKLKDRA